MTYILLEARHHTQPRLDCYYVDGLGTCFTLVDGWTARAIGRCWGGSLLDGSRMHTLWLVATACEYEGRIVCVYLTSYCKVGIPLRVAYIATPMARYLFYNRPWLGGQPESFLLPRVFRQSEVGLPATQPEGLTDMMHLLDTWTCRARLLG